MLCLGLGVVLVVFPPAALAALAMWLGGYWLVRAVSTAVHAVEVDPARWGGRGLVAVLVAFPAYLVLQPAVFADIPAGIGLGTAVGIFILVAGIVEMQIADRRDHPAMNLLGLVNALFGVGLIARWSVGPDAATAAMGWVAIAGGLLAMYATVALPRYGRRES